MLVKLASIVPVYLRLANNKPVESSSGWCWLIKVNCEAAGRFMDHAIGGYPARRNLQCIVSISLSSAQINNHFGAAGWHTDVGTMTAVGCDDIAQHTNIPSDCGIAIDGFGIQLFKYLYKRFKLIDKKLEEHDKKFSDMLDAVAELAGDIKVYHEELLILGHKVDRLERWIHQIAQETGVKLTIE